jgi:hypothetical protein
MQGFKKLTEWLESQGISHVKACMEATGRYGEKVADYLYECGHDVHVINPSCIKAFARSKLSRHKTDDVDALLIAEYASKNDLRLYKPQEPALKEMKCLYRCSQNLKEQQTQVSNYLEKKDCLPKNVQKVYQKLLSEIEKQIKVVDHSIDQLLKSQASLNQDYQNLQTIPGIGKITAITLLAEIPEINAFKNARQLAAYAGLTPSQKFSGSSVKGKPKLSKNRSKTFT